MLAWGTGGTEPLTGRRRVVRGAAVVCALGAGLGVGVALAGSGGLDPSFGTAGTTVIERPTSTFPTETGLASGGKIVAVSTSEGVITVSRLLANGVPDPTFDGDGTATITSAGSPSAHAVAVQPDGKILLIGFTNVGLHEDATVWRLKVDGGSGAPNGALDPTFGTEGTVQIATFTEATVGLAVAIQPDGKIIASGRGFNATGPEKVAVWRLTAGGVLDPSFDIDGTAEISDGLHADSANAIMLAPDGKILLAGTTFITTLDAVVWRLKANGGTGALNGALDPTFDTDGQANFDNGGEDVAEGIALRGDGKIVLAGYSQPEKAPRLAAVWRVKPDGGSGVTNGALDPTFDTDGIAGIDGGGFASAEAVALQPDGKILLAGTARAGTNPSTATLWRLSADGGTGAVNGALDPTFGPGGATTVSVGSGAGANGLALAPDRRIVVAGSTFDEKLLLFRALGDPFSLTVAKAGTGSGSVQSSSPGIACGASCSASFDDGSAVTLTATPAAGSAFAGWSGGGCSGAGTCALNMNADQAVTATFNTLPPSPPQPASPSGPPKVANVTQSHPIWSEGNKLAAVSRSRKKKAPRGTRFSYALDQQATVRFAFTQQVGGRRVRGRCVAQTNKNRHKRSCRRTLTRGTLSIAAHSGVNKLAFQGLITRSKKLPLGRYTLVITAKNSAGQHSAARSLHFTIVK